MQKTLLHIIDSLLILLIVGTLAYFNRETPKRMIKTGQHIAHATLSSGNYYYIHITKTGGNAIRAGLEKSDCNDIAHLDTHHMDVATLRLFSDKKPITIIRDPIDRFISAFYYWKYGSKDNKKWRRPQNWNKGDAINTPEDMIQILSNPKHPLHSITKKNISTYDVFTWSAHFHPQSTWIKGKDKYVAFICYDKYNLTQNIQRKFDELNITCKLPKLPVTNQSLKRSEHNLSKKAIAWLKKIYKDDFILWEKYCANTN